MIGSAPAGRGYRDSQGVWQRVELWGESAACVALWSARGLGAGGVTGGGDGGAGKQADVRYREVERWYIEGWCAVVVVLQGWRWCS